MYNVDVLNIDVLKFNEPKNSTQHFFSDTIPSETLSYISEKLRNF